MKAGLIGLSSAAIVSVYAAGYLNTQADASAAPANSVAVANIPSTTQKLPATSTGGIQSAPAPRATATPAPKNTAAAYQDGTYVGVGTSRHGSIQATVVVQGGRIVSANVTGCGTRYPCSKVAGLPGQVVARQSASVNYVSGATDSSRAYQGAVQQALAQAKV
jgi:uncharacterized protein with FMN-binding domain